MVLPQRRRSSRAFGGARARYFRVYGDCAPWLTCRSFFSLSEHHFASSWPFPRCHRWVRYDSTHLSWAVSFRWSYLTDHSLWWMILCAQHQQQCNMYSNIKSRHCSFQKENVCIRLSKSVTMFFFFFFFAFLPVLLVVVEVSLFLARRLLSLRRSSSPQVDVPSSLSTINAFPMDCLSIIFWFHNKYKKEFLKK